MRDCVFLLADSNMQAAFEGYFSRSNFHLSLDCGNFEFNPERDIKVAAGDNDPGLYTRGHELLRPFLGSHRYAVIVLDAAWDGSPGRDAIKEHIITQIRATGWLDGTFCVIVIDPELENWIWQYNEHVATGLGFESLAAMLSDPDVQTAWTKDLLKPKQPKELLETVLRKKRIPRSSSIYKKITREVSIKHCQDRAFKELVIAFKTWFPVEDNDA